MPSPPARRVVAPSPPPAAPARLLRLADIAEPGQNGFGVLRLLLALSVLVSHSYWLTTGQTSAEPLHGWTGHSLGEHAVQVFFFLSGILVAQSLIKSRSLIDYAAGRALRIFPGLIVCVLLTALALGPLLTTFGAKEYLTGRMVPAYILKTLSLSTGSAPLPGVFGDLPLPHLVNLSLWTLKYEVLCYALLAGFGLAWLKLERFRPALTLALALVVAGIFVGEAKPAETYTTADNIRYFALFFFMGTLAFLVREHLVLSWLALPILFGALGAAIGTQWAELATAAALGYAALLVASLAWGAAGQFTDRHDYSYGVYIYACPIQQALISVFPGIDVLELTALATCFVLGLAILSFELIERPAMAMRKPLAAWISGRLGARPATSKARAPEVAVPAFDVRPPPRSRVALATGGRASMRRTSQAA